MIDACTHPDFAARVNVHRIGADAGPIRNFVADVTIRCAACGVDFRFLGPPTGLSFGHPTVDITATTLHCPVAAGPREIADIPSTLRFEVA